MYRLGTIGFAYDDWAGVFYPPRVKPERRLELYARQFDTVELDTTFYAVPPRDRLRRWANAVPDSFRFSFKTPRDVTHEGLVGTPATLDVMRHFLDTMRELGERFGVILIQFPPSFGAVRAADLDKLLDVIADRGDGLRFAVEFRHGSWWSDATVRTLRSRNLAWASADQPTEAVAGVSPADTQQGGGVHAPRPAIVTADFFYLRWVGNHGQYPSNAVEVADPTPRLRWWADQLRPITPAPGSPNGSSVREIFAYAGNSYAGHGPLTVRRYMRLTGLPEPPPPELTDPTQGSLF
ncbi:MAG: DUF72 domain-containing protein [Planctomycetota bacterium]